MVKLNKIVKSFGRLRALDGVDLDLSKGAVTGLIGPNGSGKTTLVNIMTGIYTADSGEVIIKGKDLSRASAESIAGLGVARTFQNIRIFKRMTVLENVVAALLAGKKWGVAKLLSSAMSVKDPKLGKACQALETLGLQDKQKLLAEDLPLPLRRRLEIARALARDPEMILLDEPAGGMTPSETAELADLISQRVAPGRTCVVIEHKMDLISEICSHLVVLHHGEKIAEGEPGPVLGLSRVVEAYLGKA